MTTPVSGVEAPAAVERTTGDPAAGFQRSVLSLFGLSPVRIDGTAMFARALSGALHRNEMRSILCFQSPASPAVRNFLNLPNTVVESSPEIFQGGRLAAVRELMRLLQRFRPETAHLHFMPLLSPAPWILRSAGVRRVFFTDHASRPESQVDRSRPLLKRFASRAITLPFTRVVAVSDFVRNSCLAGRAFSPERVTVIYNGVDLARVDQSLRTTDAKEFRRRFRIPATATLITQISWAIPEKGIDDLLAAAVIVRSQCPDMHFCVAGEGRCLEDYRRAAAAAGLSDFVTFTGQIEDPFREGLFCASDIVCQPSRWQEAFGWVIAEAMAFGRPVVATVTGGIPEVVRDGETGFLVPRRQPSEIAARLVQLCRSPRLQRVMGDAAMSTVRQQFSMDRTIEEHLRLYAPEAYAAKVAGEPACQNHSEKKPAMNDQ